MTMRQHAHLVAVDMGYGHQRAAYALRDLGSSIVIANHYPGIPEADRALWERGRKYYETVSRFHPLPVIGRALFHAFVDHQQEIAPFYPRRDLSDVSFQLQLIRRSIVEGRQGEHLVEVLRRQQRGRHPLPFVTSFFLPAFAAEQFDYPGDIYVVVCDADIARVWAHWNPRKSRIQYFAPNGRVVERLRLYGVRRERIHLTGFPLPKELVGGPRATIVKHDLGIRIANLDPNRHFIGRERATLARHLGPHFHDRPVRPVTLTFAVGGAGAQRRTAADLLRALRGRIRRGELRLQLIAGTRREVARFFTQQVQQFRLGDALRGGGVAILYERERWQYFARFSEWIRATDILWTKPSELSFYTGLGLPIVMAPSIGSQEDFNREWLQQVGGGTDQLDPQYADEWLWDWIQAGALARMAWTGYVEAPTHGAHRIERIVRGKEDGGELETLPLVV